MRSNRYVRLVVFVTLALVLLNVVVLELFVRQVIIPKDSHYQKEQLIRSTDLSMVKTIALGDSHPFNDLLIDDPAFFNFAYHSENIVQSYYKFKYYLKRGLRPDTVLIQADEHCFSQYRESISDYTKYERFLSETDKKEIKESFPEVFLGGQSRSFDGLKQFSPEYAPFVHRTLWKYIKKGFTLKKEKEFITPTGSGINYHRFSDLTEEEKQKAAGKRFAKQFPNLDNITSPRLLAYLEKTIQLCQRNGIKAVLIRYPVTPVYFETIPEPVKQAVSDRLTAIWDRYSVLFYDYAELFKDDALFSDQDHLNDAGAERLGDLIMSNVSLH